NDANDSVCKFNNLPVATVVGNYPTNSVTPMGIGAGSDGNMIVSPGSNSTWTKINNTTGAIMPLPGPETVGNFPYTYSDFTGAQVGISGVQQGTWNVITDAGTSAHAWNFIGWNQSTPAGTSVLVEARVAQNLIVLATKPWVTIGAPGPQTPVPGRYIETRVRLQRAVEGCSPPFITPILYDLTVGAICDPCAFANCPSDTTIPCTSPQGAEFFYTPPILKSICDSTWNVSCFPNSGFFPVGTTAVTCTAINNKDETVTCTFNVTVTGGCDHPPEGACCYRGNCYITDQASCEGVGGVYMGDNTNCVLNLCRQDCVVPPNNLVAWWPFNTAAGSVTPNLAGPLTGGTLINAPTVVSGQKVQNAYSFNGTTQYINVPHNATLDLGGGDFTYDCWIRTNQSTGVATIFDKRSSGSIQGTAFFLFSGYPSLQMAVANNFSNYILTAANGGAAAFVADGNWHFIAVTVDRDDPAGIQFYVDGAAVGTPFNPVPRSGSLNNTLALLIAQRYPALGGGFFNGSLDEIEIIRRELSSSEISDLYMADVAGKCPETCYATQNATCCNGYSSSSAVTICNYSLTPQTYSFGLTPLNTGVGCGPVGANGFSPASGTVTVPAQSCVTTPIYIACPSQLLPGQAACYSVSVFNHNTGRFFGCTGSVRKVGKWCWKDVPIDITPVGGIHMVPSGGARVIQFMVGNMGPANPGLPPEAINYMIQPVRGDNGEPSRALSLNGLPPGEPVIGTLTLHGGQSDMFSIDVAYPDEALIGYDRLVIWGDDDGDGVDERLGEVAVRNFSTAVSAVPDEPSPVTGPPADASRLLLAFPNPFGASDAIKFRVDEGASVREVKLRLYDLQGRLVKAFILEDLMPPGEYTVKWDTHDNRGEPL
ncbi:MAG TPA: LamG-like jellyroll fold domain-containing protein, partial [Candidatus Eisenbacteria bacterium]